MRAHDIRGNDQAQPEILGDADLIPQRALLEVAAAEPVDPADR